MSDTNAYYFGNDANVGANGLLASIIPALQNKGLDTSYLMGLLSGNNNGGFFGNNGFESIIALIIVAAIFGNGNFGFGGGGNNNAAREMLMSAIQRNGTDEKVPMLKKEDVDAMLSRHNITIENKGGYDYVYIAQMCRADFFGSSITDESKMALFVKDYCDDADQADGFILRRWIADMTGMGEPIDWLSFIGIKE